MDTRNNISRINSYFKAQLPASVAEDVLRKLAFTYYLYKKILGECPSEDLDTTVHYLASVLSDEKKLSEASQRQSYNPYYTYHALFGNKIFESKGELIDAVESGLKDFYFYCNKVDSMQVSIILSDLTEEELLAVLNNQFEGSIRDDSTPESVVSLVLALANSHLKEKRRFIDMTCSSGSFLLKAAKEFKFVEGVEINKENALIAKMRLFANVILGEVRNCNCFEDSWHHQTAPVKSDLVFAEFPWKMIVKDHYQKEIMLNCNANRFILGPTSTTDYFFMSAMMNYLNEDGIAVTVVPLSTLSNLSDSRVREHMVRRGFVKEVIALPSNIFGRTNVATALVVFGLKKNDRVAFFDGSSYFKQEKRWINVIDVERLLADFSKAKEQNMCFFGIEELAKHDYSFSPLHYLNKVENIIPEAAELASAAEIFTGWQVPSAKLETIHKTDGTGVQLLQMSNVENGIISTKLERYDIPQTTIEKFKVEKGDVVISTKSLRVKSAVVDIDTDEPVVASGSIMVIRPKVGILDPYYLVAYFESDLGKQALELYQTGSVIPNLSINNVKKLPIPLLDYSRQLKIGSEYRDLRDLIISERRRLKALEDKANGILDNLWDSKEGE